MTPQGTAASGSRHASSPESIPKVYVVDDDVSVREGLELLIRSAGWSPETFACAATFLERPTAAVPGCVVLDIRLPDVDGLDLQDRFAVDRTHLPVVFITGYADVPMTVRAMKAGAVEFLVKPVPEDILLKAIACAIERSGAELLRDAEVGGIRNRHSTLTRRERDVLALVVAGRMNKQIAAELAISEVTVKAHRGKVMRKMGARSVAALVKMTAALDTCA
jgi:FixJ family two-component response regulator